MGEYARALDDFREARHRLALRISDAIGLTRLITRLADWLDK